jgi:DNA-binding MarR family transcriptional regulator
VPRGPLDSVRITAESADPEGLPVLGTTPGHLIRCAQQIHGLLWQQYVHVDLTSVQFGVLLVIGQRATLDQRAIGTYLSLDKSTTADVIHRLSRRGLLARERHPEDGRRKIVTLTAAGRDALVSAAGSVMAVQEAVLLPFSFSEGEELLTVLQLAAYRGAPPPAPYLPVEGWPLRLPSIRLQVTPGHLIRLAYQVHSSLWADLVAADQTSVQYNVLLALHHNPDIDQRTLGQLASLDKSTGAELLGRLEGRGLITRSQDPADARRKVLGLSAEGRRQLFALAADVMEVQHALLRPLSPSQRETFVSLMYRLCTSLEAVDG